MEYNTEVLQFLVIFILSQLGATVVSGDVTWSCHEKTGSCYYSPQIKRSYAQASCWCRSIGGHLIKIDSQDELALVRDLIDRENRQEGFIIGATDMKEEGNFVWEDSTPAQHIPWHVWDEHTAEPDNHLDQEHCVLLNNKILWKTPPIYLNGSDAFDGQCTAVYNFVCERNSGFSPSRFWDEMSRDVIFPSAELLSVSGMSQLGCTDLCMKTCGCFSLGYKKDGGDCILYDTYYSRLINPQSGPGYITFN